jgi:N-acetylglutamate synthase-like GNAT family acetyltransferase
MPNAITIRPARTTDLTAVRALLSGANLPLDGLEEQFGDGYAVAESGGAVIGAEGIETYDDTGLLRSAVVDPRWRGQGVGDALTRDRLNWARERGLREVYLLTTTAQDYFPRHGFERVMRTSAPEAVQRSREFAEACPDSAITMRLLLHPQPVT